MINLPFLSNITDLFQTIFIVVGFYFTAKTFMEEGRSRKVEFLMGINERYQDIKTAVLDNPELDRVFKNIPSKNLAITPKEKAFAQKVINHIYMIYFTVKEGQLKPFKGMENDIRNILSYTIPSIVWKDMKPFQDDDFVVYVDGLL